MDEKKKIEKTELNIGAEIKTPADEGYGRGVGGDNRDEDRIKGKRLLMPEDKIFDLLDIVEEGEGIPSLYPGMNEEIMEMVSQITEKIAREMIPEIATRVIGEEVEKLKRDGYGKQPGD